MTARIHTGFKVVSHELGSAMVQDRFTCHVQYKIGEWVKRRSAKHGPLAVFNTLIAAKRFLDTNGGVGCHPTRIFECKFTESKAECLKSTMDTRMFWNGWSLKSDTGIFKRGTVTLGLNRDLPVGTKLANQVMLTKEVK